MRLTVCRTGFGSFMGLHTSSAARACARATRPLLCSVRVGFNRLDPKRCSAVGRRSLTSDSTTSLRARFWEWTSQQRPHWRDSKEEAAVLFTVFGVTGSTSVALVRPSLKHTIGLDGTWRDGPWSYRIGSLLLVSPIYAGVLIALGTACGRHAYFARMGTRILGRFMPKAAADRLLCASATRVRQQAAFKEAASGGRLPGAGVRKSDTGM